MNINDHKLSSMKAAQLKLATELAARGWPPLVFSEVLSYPCADDKSWLAHVETESGEAISVGFVTPFAIAEDDNEKIARLNDLFWAGCKIEEHAEASSCAS